ncbi:MAG TPA: hypothetical protein VHO29_08935 [Marmoricola sp.]|nr:hypothetical protein [Marmoricola sp.]
MSSAWVRGTPTRQLRPVDAVGVFAVALVARLVQLLHGGAATGANGYDQSVYYAAADAVLHGRVPYRSDFVFLHPPGIIFAGLPYALLGRLTDASTGFLAENIAFSVLASCAAALITVVARRAGAPRWAAIGAGVVYATWSITVYGGSSARLEPLGDLLMVVAAYFLGPGRNPSRQHLVAAGLVLGLLVNVKVWWILPGAMLVALTLPHRHRVREWSVVPVAAAATALLIDLPFMLMSHGHMFVDVIAAQLRRPDVQITPSGNQGRLSTMVRLERLTGVDAVMHRLFGISAHDRGLAVPLVTLMVCALVLVTSALALRTRLGRVFAPILLAQLVVLLATPIYYPYYGDYLGVSVALVVAAAARPTGSRPTLSWRATWPTSWPALWPMLWPVGAVLTLFLLLTSPPSYGLRRAPDSETLARPTGDIPCIVADTPWALIDLNALDRSFEPGCRDWVDFQGVGHGGVDPAAYVVGDRATPAWRRIVSRYLASGDAVVLSDPATSKLLTRHRSRVLLRRPLVAYSKGVLVLRSLGPGTCRTTSQVSFCPAPAPVSAESGRRIQVAGR